MLVKDVMTRDVHCALRETPLREVARLMVQADCGEIPVLESSETPTPVGVITDRDIVTRAVAQGVDVGACTAERAMTRNVVCVRADADIEEGARLMSENQIRRVPVVDDAYHVLGILSLADLGRMTDPRMVGQAVHDISMPEAPRGV